MPRKPSPQPNEVEMQILAALWDLGPSTARQVHDALLRERQTGYSSTVKMLQVMTEKGLVTKDESRRPQLFHAAKPRDKTRGRMVRDLVQRAFGGAVSKLIQSAVSSQKVTPQELEEIKRIIRKAEEKQ